MKFRIPTSENVIVLLPKPKSEQGDKRPNEPMLREKPVWNLELATPDHCTHINVEVCDAMADVTCRDCGEKLNPIFVLRRMAKHETKWEMRRAEFIKQREALESRQRCKCEHCGKITRIQK